jgi:hypothetical protein
MDKVWSDLPVGLLCRSSLACHRKNLSVIPGHREAMSPESIEQNAQT